MVATAETVSAVRPIHARVEASPAQQPPSLLEALKKAKAVFHATEGTARFVAGRLAGERMSQVGRFGVKVGMIGGILITAQEVIATLILVSEAMEQFPQLKRTISSLLIDPNHNSPPPPLVFPALHPQAEHVSARDRIYFQRGRRAHSLIGRTRLT